jgi:hypothetical protein
MKTYTQWLKENESSMDLRDFKAWLAEAWVAGYDVGIKVQQEINARQQEDNA